MFTAVPFAYITHSRTNSLVPSPKGRRSSHSWLDWIAGRRFFLPSFQREEEKREWEREKLTISCLLAERRKKKKQKLFLQVYLPTFQSLRRSPTLDPPSDILSQLEKNSATEKSWGLPFVLIASIEIPTFCESVFPRKEWRRRRNYLAWMISVFGAKWRKRPPFLPRYLLGKQLLVRNCQVRRYIRSSWMRPFPSLSALLKKARVWLNKSSQTLAYSLFLCSERKRRRRTIPRAKGEKVTKEGKKIPAIGDVKIAATDNFCAVFLCLGLSATFFGRSPEKRVGVTDRGINLRHTLPLSRRSRTRRSCAGPSSGRPQ